MFSNDAEPLGMFRGALRTLRRILLIGAMCFFLTWRGVDLSAVGDKSRTFSNAFSIFCDAGGDIEAPLNAAELVLRPGDSTARHDRSVIIIAGVLATLCVGFPGGRKNENAVAPRFCLYIGDILVDPDDDYGAELGLT
jgi:hypothetical protein